MRVPRRQTSGSQEIDLATAGQAFQRLMERRRDTRDCRLLSQLRSAGGGFRLRGLVRTAGIEDV